MYRYTCLKCDGKGYIKAFSHVVGGVCYSCGGSGFKETKNKKVEKQNYSVVVMLSNGAYIPCFNVRANSLKSALKSKSFKKNKESKFILSELESEKISDLLKVVTNNHPYDNDYSNDEVTTINEIMNPYVDKYLLDHQAIKNNEVI